ncbi:MAG: hypothetical protein SOZ67_02630 [Alloprevotella sp.]|nr:hypothetical protein [Alloprevotella sp.]
MNNPCSNSLRLSVSLTLRLFVSLSLRLFVFSSLCLFVSLSLRLPKKDHRVRCISTARHDQAIQTKKLAIRRSF